LEKRVLLAKVNKIDRSVATAYLVSATFKGLAMCLIPIGKNVLAWLLDNGNYNYDMPMKATYYYDVKESPAFEVTYLSVCLGIYVTVLMSVS
jgi:hypothetical protein